MRINTLIFTFILISINIVYAQNQSFDTCSTLKKYTGFWYKVNCTDTLMLHLKYNRVKDSLGNERDYLYGWHRYKIRDSIIENNIPPDINLLEIKSAPSIILKPYDSCNLSFVNSLNGFSYDFNGNKIDSVVFMANGKNAMGFNYLVYPIKSNLSSVMFKTNGSFIKKNDCDYIILSDGKNNFSNKIDLSLWNEYPLPDFERTNIANTTLIDWAFEKSDESSFCIKCYDANTSKKKDTQKDSLLILINEKSNLHYYIRDVIKVLNGKLVTYGYFESRGEEISFISNKKNSYKIKNIGEVLKLFKFNNKIFCLTGFSHFGGTQEGKIYEIKFKNKSWKAVLVCSGLDSNPKQVLITENEAIILTSESLYKFSKDLAIRKLFNAPFNWSQLYPSSIIRENDNLYIAMRMGILKISDFENKQSFHWFQHK